MVVHCVGSESGAQVGLGDGHADGIGEALAKRTGGDLDAGGVADFRMTRCERAPLAELFEVLEFEAVATEKQHRILEDRDMATGQNEPVAIGPVRVRWVVLHHPAVQSVSKRRESHPGALVAAVCGERAIHRHTSHQRDGGGVLFSSQRHASEGS